MDHTIYIFFDCGICLKGNEIKLYVKQLYDFIFGQIRPSILSLRTYLTLVFKKNNMKKT